MHGERRRVGVRRRRRRVVPRHGGKVLEKERERERERERELELVVAD